MDTIIMIMFGAVISMSTTLTFMEVRRMRKAMERQAGSERPQKTAVGA